MYLINSIHCLRSHWRLAQVDQKRPHVWNKEDEKTHGLTMEAIVEVWTQMGQAFKIQLSGPNKHRG